MKMQGLAHECCLAVREPGQRTHADAIDGVTCRAGVDAHLQGRAPKPVKQQAAERLEARVPRYAEAHQQLELALGLEVGASGATVKLIFKLRQCVLVEL